MADIPALGILLDNLNESVLYNTGLIGGPINNDLKGLCEDLDALKGLIKNYQGWQNDEEFIQKVGNVIRDAIFQAEYAIETYIVCASKKKHRGVIAKSVHITEYSELRSLGKQIVQTREQLAKLRQSYLPWIWRKALQVDEISSGGPTKKQALLFMEDNVVGLEDSAEEVIRLLTGESQQQSDELEVISIIGMPGLGKTTLAKKVFNDPKIEYEFYARAFVHVSQEYERKDLFLRILATITQIDEEMNKMSEDELARVLREQLGTKKFLIVMDDVWTTDAWDKLKSAFPNNNKGSRVLLTSRHASVAHYANRKIGPYYMRFLFSEECRELLRRKVFGENFCPREVERYEPNILDKCDGLPLAIIVVAGILLNNRESTDWWMRVAENVNDYVAKNGEQSNDAIIRSSYNHLPDYLKPCFLYLGVFPDSFEIPVWRLLRLWIAEGFIQHEGFMNMEDTAEEYLRELVDRSLVMIGQKRSNGQIKTCRINDMLRYFCKTEAMKGSLFREIKRFDQATSSSDKYRRLFLNSHVVEYIKAKPTGDHVRSFLCFSKEENLLLPEHLSSIPKAFKLLRVLDVRSIVFTRFPVEFIYLVLLKYIAISCNFKVLPEKMSNLQNLQTIVIETSFHTLEIRADIWKMAQLRHLHSSSSTYLRKGKEESLINANLQTLSTISAESCRREVFEKTPKLRKLGIRGGLGTIIEGEGDSSVFDSLARLNFLENLKLLNDDTARKLHSFPPENKFPRKLTRLTLLNTSLDWRHMSTLGKLENLEVLKLKDNAFVGQLWVTEDGGFRRLTVLHIGRTDIVVWKASASNFPTLRSLFLRHCDKLDGIPPDLGDIPSLHLIDLYYTNSMVASSARKILLLNLRLKAQEKILKGSKLKLSVYPPDF